MSRWGKSRRNYWVHALVVGVLLTGEAHLFTAEIFHHHTDVARVCQIEHDGGTYLHASLALAPLCPICQVITTSSIRPAVQSLIYKAQQDSHILPPVRRSQYSSNLTVSLLARAPPLS